MATTVETTASAFAEVPLVDADPTAAAAIHVQPCQPGTDGPYGVAIQVLGDLSNPDREALDQHLALFVGWLVMYGPDNGWELHAHLTYRRSVQPP